MSNIDKLLEVMARLRDPDEGCPWDLQQDFASIAPYTVEEAYEVADAIARADMESLRDELGDLLFQVVFHSRMAEEAGSFAFPDVAAAITDKMLRRHPHVFGDATERAAGHVPGSWDRIKARERNAGDDDSALAGVVHALPALKRAQKLGKRASTVGFDWPDASGVRDKVDEELAELAAAADDNDAASTREEIGDLLFAVVNLARHLGVDAETALAAANHKFERRFRDMEQAIRAAGKSIADLSFDALDEQWRAAKARVG
jgi:ATP diphosphatase